MSVLFLWVHEKTKITFAQEKSKELTSSCPKIMQLSNFDSISFIIEEFLPIIIFILKNEIKDMINHIF